MVTRKRGYGYWISTVLLAFILISGGLWLMVGNQPMDTYLGYPAYFGLSLALQGAGRDRDSCPAIPCAEGMGLCRYYLQHGRCVGLSHIR
jgi:hypothetical protein